MGATEAEKYAGHSHAKTHGHRILKTLGTRESKARSPRLQKPTLVLFRSLYRKHATRKLGKETQLQNGTLAESTPRCVRLSSLTQPHVNGLLLPAAHGLLALLHVRFLRLLRLLHAPTHCHI